MSRFSQKAAIQQVFNVDPNGRITQSYGITILEYTSENKPCMVIWYGKKAQPEHHYDFANTSTRERIKLQELAKAKSKYEQKHSFVPTLTAGEYYVSNWGQKAANVDFFELIRPLSKHSAEFRPIHYHHAEPQSLKVPLVHHAYHIVEPNPGFYSGPPFVKRLLHLESCKDGQLTQYFKINSYQSAFQWDGKPVTITTMN